MRGAISVIGIFMFLVLALFFIYVSPAFVAVIGDTFGSVSLDPFTWVAVILIIPTIFYALVSGFWNSMSGA